MLTMDDLRNQICAEMERITSGDSNPASANAYANLCGKLLSTIKVEIDYNKLSGSQPNIPFLGKTNSKKLDNVKKLK